MKTLRGEGEPDGDEAMPPATMEGDQAEERGEGEMPMGGMREVCVPLRALAMPDESEQMEPPAVGDAIQFNGEGKVSRIEGDNAYVTLSAVNGQELPREKAAEPSEEQEYASLEEAARNQPQD